MSGRIRNKSRHYWYLISSFIGLIVFIWSGAIYRLTFVPFIGFCSGILALGLVATLLNLHRFKAAYLLPTWMYFPLAWGCNTISWGFIFSSLFLLSNFMMAGGEVKRKEFAIVARDVQPGGKGERELLRPTFTISYQGQEKELVFANRFYKWKDDCKSVILTLQEGLWGFEVIKGKAVTK